MDRVTDDGGRRTVVVVSRDRLFGDATARFLVREGWDVRLEEADGIRALGALARDPVDAVVVLGELGHISARTFKSEAQRRWPDAQVVLVPAGPAEPAGDVAADAGQRDVLDALMRPSGAAAPAPSETERSILQLTRLTARERTVLRHLSEGRSPAAIAELLGVSRHTVRSHMGNLHRKLGVHKRVELIRIAAAAGLLSSGNGGTSSLAAGSAGQS